MIFQFPKCGSCVDSMVVVIFLDALPYQCSTIFVLSGPFFFWPLLRQFAPPSHPFWLWARKCDTPTSVRRHQRIRGHFFVTLAALLIVWSASRFTSIFLTNMCSDVWLIEYNRFYLKISLFLTIIWLLFNHRLPVQKGICIKITLFALNMMVKRSLEIFILKSLRFLPQITNSVTKLTFFQHWVSK